MVPWNITVAGCDGDPADVDVLRRRLLDTWSGAAPLRATVARVEDLESVDMTSIDAVVLTLAVPGAVGRAWELLATLEEEGVAAIVVGTFNQKDAAALAHAGALVVRAEDQPEHASALLEGVLHRQRAVGRLRSELNLAYRFHGGLKGEIARMHDELQLAAMVQREFLPRSMPRVCGVEFATLWRPAHYVSGDIYDVSALDDDHVGVFLADAVGHGVPAALMTMIISRSLTTRTTEGGHGNIIEPSEVLAKLNHDLIRRQGRSTRFATAVYAVVNCRERTMRLAGAGHPPSIHMRADGTSEELETEGGLLGIFENEKYDQIEVELGESDRVLFHSDGFEQAFPAASADPYERRLPTTRYRDEFAALGAQPGVDAMIDAIARRLDDQCGSLHQIDDLTLVCMHTKGLAESDGAGESDGATERRSDGGGNVPTRAETGGA